MQEARANLLPTVFLLTAFGLLKANSEYSNFLNTVLEKNGHAAFENQEHREREEPCGEYRGSCLAYAQPEEECHVQYSGYTAVIYRFEHPCFHQAGHIRSRQENPAGIFWYLARKYYEAGDFDLPMVRARACWEIPCDYISLTFYRSVHYSLFETHPEMIQFFGNLRDLPPDMIKESKELRQHALRVMGFIEKCIARISSPEKLDAIIRQLGRHHVRYGAPPAFLQLVGPQFINAIRLHLETRWSPETEDAWLNLFSYIAYGMKQAMLTATDVQTPTPDLL
ncbi:hypothetical protein RvY_05727-1 [Ramazzottius varieornatus]|uniref:Globin domain-containing protein n=1 Tax=Ramazzottius varieornatus TaxID=947166 RepID=A0A1D1UW26_RAMVA|nr:hypothetical protein RvY_05727-1 [Ramazzottius varieornatus]